MRKIGPEHNGQFIPQDVTLMAEKRKNYIFDVFGDVVGLQGRIEGSVEEFTDCLPEHGGWKLIADVVLVEIRHLFIEQLPG